LNKLRHKEASELYESCFPNFTSFTVGVHFSGALSKSLPCVTIIYLRWRWNTDRSGHNWGRNIRIQRKLRFTTHFRRRTQGAHCFDWRRKRWQSDSASRTSKKKTFQHL